MSRKVFAFCLRAVCVVAVFLLSVAGPAFATTGGRSPVAGGDSHSVTLLGGGRNWGSNRSGQLGLNVPDRYLTPVQVPALSDIAAVSTGLYHTMALSTNGVVWTWGTGSYGQLGDGTTKDRTSPVQVTDLTGVVAVAAGSFHALALTHDGTVWAWGSNSYGQLGTAQGTNYRRPAPVVGLSDVIAIAAGESSSMAVKADGTVWTWGSNSYGQLGDGTTTGRSTPSQVPGLTDVTQISMASNHAMALRSDGTVWTWGSNSNGQVGDGTTTQRLTPVQVPGLTGVTQIAAAWVTSVAVKADGSVWQWGYGGGSSPRQVAGISGVQRVAVGTGHTLAVKSDGTVWGWGWNFQGQLGDGTTANRSTPVQVTGLSDVAVVAATEYRSMAVKADGTFWAWGLDAPGHLGLGYPRMSTLPVRPVGLTTDTIWPVQMAPGSGYTLALMSDGTVRAWGANGFGQLGDGTNIARTAPVAVPNLTDIQAVSAGNSFSLALKSDGTVWAWGMGEDGELGDGLFAYHRMVPGIVPGLSGIVAISAGQYHALALAADGTIWAWGENVRGQIGDGTTTNKGTPIQIPGLSDVVAVAAGTHHSLAVKSDGTVWAWGNNTSGQLGNGTTTPNMGNPTPAQVPGLTGVTAVAAGNGSLALRTDGTVWQWGHAGTQILTVPTQVPGLSNVEFIGAGAYHLLAAKTDGTVWTWGYNWNGELGDGTEYNRTTPVRVNLGPLDGAGTLTADTARFSAGRTGRTVRFTYQAGADGISNGAISIDVPAGWTAPATASTAPGYVTASAGTVSVTGQTIVVSGLTLPGHGSLTVTYGDHSGGGPGATVQSTPGLAAFMAKSKVSADGTLFPLKVSPILPVYGADGGGTLAYTGDGTVAGQTGRTLSFTYTAAVGGMRDGAISVAIPAGWPAPSTDSLAPGYTTASAGTLTVNGQTISINHLTLMSGEPLTITYGDKRSGSAGVTVPAAPGPAAFTALSKSIAEGALTALAAPASVPVYGPDGSGTMALAETVFSAGQTGRTLTFTYTAGAGGMNGGAASFEVPAGWTAPSTDSTAPGYTTASSGTVSATDRTVTVTDVTLAAGGTVTITYGDRQGGGTGVTVPAAPGTAAFAAASKTVAGGTLTPLDASPGATIYAADGSGALALPATYVSAGQTGLTLSFTYTAAAGGINNGTVTLTVPAGWTPPSTTATAAGYVTASTGTVTATGQTIKVDGVTLSGGARMTITYSAATAPATPGTASFTAQSKATAGGTLANLSAPVTATIYAPDGSGTLTLPQTYVSPGQAGVALTFTYTAAAGGMKDGTVTVAVPTGWTAPSTTSTAPGYTTASTGTVTATGQTIRVDGVTLSAGGTLTITYSAATAANATGTASFAGQSRATAGGMLKALGAPATAQIMAANGSGTLTLPPTKVSAGQRGLTLTFTYTAATGGMKNGTVTVTAPAGWSAPSTTATAAGYTTASSGTVTTSGQTIRVDGVTLSAGGTLTITYSAATASNTPGTASFTGQSRSTPGGTLANLSAQATATVYAPDGSGALALPATNVSAGQTGLTLPFTYTAATGGLSNGTVTLTVPSGWTPPSTTATAAGYVTASTGTVTVSGQTIRVDGVTLNAGATMTITYSAATASATPGTASFTAQSKATAGGTLTNLSAPASATVYAADGSGALTLPETNVSAGQGGRTLTFTYTAAAGGMKSGAVTLTVPAGWTAPSTASTAPGYTTASAGTVTVTGQTIKVDGVTLNGGATLTITYSAATASTTPGASAFTGQSKATAGGTLKPLSAPATATIFAADGSGTLAVDPRVITEGGTGATLTFTYTAAPGGMKNGAITVMIPDGWSAPSLTPTDAGYTRSSTGVVTVSGRKITISGLTLGAGQMAAITYGDRSGGGPGAPVPATEGTYTFIGQQQSTGGSALTDLTSAPTLSLQFVPVPPEEITVERDPQTGDVVLRWNAGSRTDVTYLVYRSTMDGSELGRHNQLRAAPVLVNGVWEFRDSLVHRGAANLVLVYWVVAVDSSGRQSLPSTRIYVNP